MRSGAVLLSRERQAAGSVARHLLALGHRRIAMITGPQDMISAIERRAGFIEVVAEAGVGQPAEVERDYSLAAGMAAVDRLLAASRVPTAIFAANDLMVPGALSAVGFEGSIVAEMLTPSLTTVSRPFGDMADMATRHLIEGQLPCDPNSPALSLVPARSSGPAPTDSGPSSP